MSFLAVNVVFRFRQLNSAAWMALLAAFLFCGCGAGCGGGGGAGGGTSATQVNLPGGGGSTTGTGIAVGRVINATSGLAIANYTATADSGQSVNVVSSATGQFTITGVTAGSRFITIAAAGFTTAASATLTVTANLTTDFGTIALTAGGSGPPVPPVGGGSSNVGTVTGQIVDVNFQTPVNTNQTINNFIVTTDTGQSVTVVGANFDNAAVLGSFRIPNVTAGNRTLTVTAPGYQTRVTSFLAVVTAQTTDFGKIALTPNPVVPGQGGQGGQPPAPPGP